MRIITIVCLLGVIILPVLAYAEDNQQETVERLEPAKFYLSYDKRGLICSNRKLSKAYKDVLDKTLAREPDNLYERQNRATVLINLNQPELAIKDYEYIREKWPGSELRGLASVYKILGDKKAELQIRKELQRLKSNPNGLPDTAYLYELQGKLEEAEQIWLRSNAKQTHYTDLMDRGLFYARHEMRAEKRDTLGNPN